MASLQDYQSSGYKKVMGWLRSGAVEMVVALAGAQSDLGIAGPVAEIGVYHGKLFILLCLLRNEGEKAVAVDLFDLGEHHANATVKGDRERMTNNLERHADSKNVTIHQGNSSDLSATQLISMAGEKFRLLSIDGGHTEEVVSHDLEIVENSLAEGGIIIHDDFFNELWPDVSVATVRFFDQPRGIVPFAVGGDKIMFCHPQYAARYKAALKELPAKTYERKFLGADVVCMDFKSSWLVRTVTASDWWKKSRNSELGKLMRRFK